MQIDHILLTVHQRIGGDESRLSDHDMTG
jgi:hypothetical protein